MNTFLKTALILAGLLLVTGCGHSSDIGLVTGVIQINGEPVEGAFVSFYPVEGGRSAIGLTAADGSYELKYKAGVKGTKVGVNRINLTTYKEANEDDDGHRITGTGTPERFPPDYNTEGTITVEVVPGNNVIDFDVQADKERYPRPR